VTGGARLLDGRRVLLAGESWVTQEHHSKGVVSYTTGSYVEGGEPLIEALEQGGASVVYLPNHRAGKEFPRHAEELGRYSTVILSDIASDTLLLDRACFVEGVRSVNRLDLVTRYVEAGGSLLMVGGYMSFSGFEGKAHYALTPLADILPVVVSESDDRVETPEGLTPTVRDGRHPVLDGIEGEWPYFLGYNRLVAKDGAEVPLSFGEDPLLVLAQHGAGRVAAFASDCSPHWGSRDFLSWPHYARFWTQLVAWLADPRGGVCVLEALPKLAEPA
jgi:uncharacterized membrane protein